MKIETDGAFASCKQQLAVAEEVSEALLAGVGGMEHAWFEQTREMLDAELKLFQAAMTLRDPWELVALQTAFFSRPPKDLLETQQQFLNAATETQTKISNALGKHMARLKAESKPLRTTSVEGDSTNPTEMLYSIWNRMFQNAAEFASIGMKTLPPAMANLGNPLLAKNEAAHAKQK
jgi:hypothetical protein